MIVSKARANQFEGELRERLKNVRLVAEIGLDFDLYQKLHDTVSWLGQDVTDRHYSALLVSYLVAEGVFSYEAGKFWPQISVAGLRRSYQSLGPAFIVALHQLGLEDFEHLVEQEHALRYVGPILAHGGIPKYCLGDFFRLLSEDLNRGIREAGDLLSRWRSTPSRFVNIDKPVRRFLLYGGELAADFVDRCVDLLQESTVRGTMPGPSEVGLPPHVVDAFALLDQDVRQVIARVMISRPFVHIDPWDPLGPTLELPAVSRDLANASWYIRDGQASRRLASSTLRSQTVRLSPAREWDVELRRDAEVLRSFSFECFERLPALFFDPGNGRLVRDPIQLRLGDAWVLCPNTLQIRALRGGEVTDIHYLERLPDPVGPWSGYSMAHLELGQDTTLELTTQAQQQTKIRVLAGYERPHLEGAIVTAVTTATGHPVYAAPPRVSLPFGGGSLARWVLRWRVEGRPQVAAACDLPRIGDDVVIPLDGRFMGIVDLSVRGPVGSDLQTTVSVVPGLRVQRPQHLLYPSDRDAQVLVEAAPWVSVAGGHPGDITAISVPDSADAVEFTAGDGCRDLSLRVQVSRLLWGVARDGEPAITLGDRPLPLTVEDFEARKASLIVSTGTASVPVRLCLHARQRVVQYTDMITTSSRSGRWCFDLSQFGDTLRMHPEPRLGLTLEAGDRWAHVGTVTAHLALDDIQASSDKIDGTWRVRVRFSEERAFRNRVLRLWPLWRPWLPALVAPVPDEQQGEALISDLISPGPYLAELDVDDGWVTPKRPTTGAPNCTLVHVGDTDDLAHWRTSLRDTDPLEVLTALISGDTSRGLDDAGATAVANEMCVALTLILADPIYGAPTSHPFAAVRDLCVRHLPVSLAAFARMIDEGRIDEPAMARIAAALAGPGWNTRCQGEIGGEILVTLWNACPVLAAAVDLRRAPFDQEARSRCSKYLGLIPGDPDPQIGKAEGQSVIDRTPDDLRHLERILQLDVRRVLDYDSFVATQFEWLIAAKEQVFDLKAWERAHRWLADRLPALPEVVRSHIDARRAPLGVEVWRWLGLSSVTLSAAIHTVWGGLASSVAEAALMEAAAFAPRLVMRDLLLAMWFSLRQEQQC